MNELHLFAGAGGGILGGHLLGHTCVCAVEWDAYARRVLLARQRDGVLPRFPIWDDVQTFDGTPWRGRVDVVAGGFPCQDISAAGKGAGIDGERSGMWRHMARIVGEVRPRYVLVENSPILTSRGLGVVLGDLAAMGYDAEWCVLGASDAGAPHRRERIWILAADTANGRPQGRQNRNRLHGPPPSERGSKPIGVGSGVAENVAYSRSRRRPTHKLRARRDIAGICGQDVADADSFDRRGGTGGKDREKVDNGSNAMADADSKRSKAGLSEQKQRQERQSGELVNGSTGRPSGGGWWGAEPDVGRVANGVAARVDRLRCIGNGQVPAVAAFAWRTLMERIQNR